MSALVVKLSNPAAHDVENANRVANDVAAQHIARRALARAGPAPLVPEVYAWAPATATGAGDEDGFGWIMSEFRGGVDLDSVFPSLPPGDKERVLGQMAAVLGVIQSARLPEGVTKFGGGLNFDCDGQIVSEAPPCVQDAKPAVSYAEWRAGKLRSQFRRAAESTVLQGWASNGIAERIEALLAGGGPEKVLAGVDVHRKCLIHGDLSVFLCPFDSVRAVN